jgi:hypothetical protein
MAGGWRGLQQEGGCAYVYHHDFEGLFSSGQALAERVAGMLGYRSMSRELLLETAARYEIRGQVDGTDGNVAGGDPDQTGATTSLSGGDAGRDVLVQGGKCLPRAWGQEFLPGISMC